MSDADQAASPVGNLSAGALLRAAREKQGLHIAALAAAIKVSPRKLEALEADRYAELPDLTFTRALAQTMCRALKIDAESVLAKLPQPGDTPRLAQLAGGINAPFRESPGRRDPGRARLLRRPELWATLAVALGALTLAFVPDHWVSWRATSKGAPPSVAPPASAQWPASAAATSAAPAAPVVASAQNEAGHSAPPAAQAGSAAVAAMAAGVLAVRTTAQSWVEVQDAKGQPLLSRLVQPGETVDVDGELPLRVTIGNAAVTQLAFRGQAVDLAASTRDNVARLSLP